VIVTVFAIVIMMVIVSMMVVSIMFAMEACCFSRITLAIIDCHGRVGAERALHLDTLGRVIIIESRRDQFFRRDTLLCPIKDSSYSGGNEFSLKRFPARRLLIVPN
jgi:hypothetical protein